MIFTLSILCSDLISLNMEFIVTILCRENMVFCVAHFGPDFSLYGIHNYYFVQRKHSVLCGSL
jgi:hypothetical protein